MKIYTLICTREDEENFSPTLKALIYYLSRVDIEVKPLIKKNSIFSAYDEALKELNPSDEDIIILCHDDIEILNDVEVFKRELIKGLSDEKTAFVGVAGSKTIGKDAVWWSADNFKQGKLRGLVYHGDSIHNMMPSLYGPQSDSVITLDGLFLAAKAKTLRKIGLEKPFNYPGEWDFYDIHYTVKAYNEGYINRVIPILIRHQSTGESMFTRESWNKNRMMFIKDNFLPLTCK